VTTDDAAFAEFPELRRLIDLRDGGWLFVPRRVDGELDRLDAVRTWPDGSADAIMINYVTDAAALRIDPSGGLVWMREGTLAEVADALLTLPPPGNPDAPRFVRGAAPPL
jgi:hypothetical protein